MNWICKVSLCNRRTNSRYKNQEKSWDWLKDRNRNPVRTTETAEEYGVSRDKVTPAWNQIFTMVSSSEAVIVIDNG